MEDREKVYSVIKDLNNSSNKELEFALKFLNEEFNRTKTAVIELTKHLDGVEIIYNKVLKEYERRK
jgi:hypothetical protein